jgi:hypothetical protein
LAYGKFSEVNAIRRNQQIPYIAARYASPSVKTIADDPVIDAIIKGIDQHEAIASWTLHGFSPFSSSPSTRASSK